LLLQGEKIDLRILERDDYHVLAEWLNKPEIFGEDNPLNRITQEEIGKMFDGPHGTRQFIVQNKEGRHIGYVSCYYVLHPSARWLEVGYSLIPSERGKGYGTEALRILVDYLFITEETDRIQAQTDQDNLASQKILEKTGFKKEGITRKAFHVKGEYRDSWIYSILRDEWKGPRILTK